MTTVAIHGDSGFSSRWKEIAEQRGCTVSEIDGYHTDIVKLIRNCDVLLWHLNHDQIEDLQFARNILGAIETTGKKVFPNHSTASHFDDKLAQKYLLESIEAPLAQTWVFYSQSEAKSFLKTAEYPLVFKLRRGAGSMNVRKVAHYDEALKLVNRMFSRGISAFPTGERLRRTFQRAVSKKKQTRPFHVRAVNVLRQFLHKALISDRERGYVLFQRFIADNDHDIRATVIGDRCFLFFRAVRPNDFRASGSGKIIYPDESAIPRDIVDLAFKITRTLGFQSMAYDFVRDPVTKAPLLLEMSYVFNAQAIANCAGYLDSSDRWHPGQVWPQDAILDDILS